MTRLRKKVKYVWYCKNQFKAGFDQEETKPVFRDRERGRERGRLLKDSVKKKQKKHNLA